MDLLAILGLVISANLDTLVVGLSYGCRRMRLPFLSNVICALIPSIGTYVMMMLGQAVKFIVPAPSANALGAVILIAVGAFMIAQSFSRQRAAGLQKKAARLDCEVCGEPPVPRNVTKINRILDDPVQADSDYSGSIDTREATVLALALTLNNLSCGFGAGLMGLSMIMAPCTTFIICLVFLAAGIRIGHSCMSRWFGERGDLAAGLLLILIGVYEILH